MAKRNIFNFAIALGLLSTMMTTSEFSRASEIALKIPDFSHDRVSWNYSCLTSRNYIQTYAGNNTYTSFNVLEEPTNSELSNPDFILRDGRITYQTKQKLIMIWKDGSYTYQLTFFGTTGLSPESIMPLSGNVIIRKGKKVISNQRCIKVGSAEITSF
jgi:hypothetical protein